MNDLELVRAWRNDDGEVVVEVVGTKSINTYPLDADDAKRLHRELSEAIGHDCFTEAATALAAEAKRRKMEEGEDDAE